MNDRVISPAASREDELLDASIRPQKLGEYLGQEAVREQLGIYIEAARRRVRRHVARPATKIATKRKPGVKPKPPTKPRRK